MIDRSDDDDSGGSGTGGSNCANSLSIRYRDILDDDDDDDDLGMFEDDDEVMNDDPIREDLLEEVFCADIANIGDADSSPSSSSSPSSAGVDPSSSMTEPQKKPWWFRSQMMKEDSGVSRSTSESNSNKNSSGSDNRNMSGRDEGGEDGGRRGSSTSAGTSSSAPRKGRRTQRRRLSLERDDSMRRKLERRQRLSRAVAGQTGDEPGHQWERRTSDLSSHGEGAGQDKAADESAGDAPSTRGGEGGTTRVVRRLSGIFSGGVGGDEGDGGGYDPLNKQGSSRSDDFAAEDQRRRRELEKELSGLMTASTVGLEESSSDDANAWRSLSGRKVRGRSWSSSRHCGGGLIAAKLGMRRERLLVVTLTLIMALIACMGAVSVYQRREARIEPPGEVETASVRGSGGPTDDHARDDTFPAVAPRNEPANEHTMTEQDLISTMKERGPPPKALLSLLSSISGSASLIGDPNSASHRAMQWLLYKDAEEWQRLSWDYDTDDVGGGPMGSDLRARIEQRFALAAVYFTNVATGDGTLRGWMTGEHECDWQGVGCAEFGSDPRAGGVRVVTDLDLSRSGLRGQIPDELRALTRLEHLMLQENELTGSIPSWINELESLDSLYLSNNMLSGKIPEELSLLPSLEELWIEGNSLSGAAPQAMCQRVHILVADCLGARPRVECTCCSSCFP